MMPEVEVLNYHGLIVSINSDDEELLKEKDLFKNLLQHMLECNYGTIEITINEDEIREWVMSWFEYANFYLILDSSKLEPGTFQMRIIGEIEYITSSNLSTNPIIKFKRKNIFHFEFDERGDKKLIYDNYKMNDQTPKYMIERAIRMKDNKFLKWVISSYPEDIKHSCLSLFVSAIENDNAEAFHLLEDLNPPNIFRSNFLSRFAEDEGKPEYAEYIKNHYEVFDD